MTGVQTCALPIYQAVEAGGAKTIALNAADEVAVAAFLEGAIGFPDIPATIEAVVRETPARIPESIEEVLSVDNNARLRARDRIQCVDSKVGVKGVSSPP